MDKKEILNDGTSEFFDSRKTRTAMEIAEASQEQIKREKYMERYGVTFVETKTPEDSLINAQRMSLAVTGKPLSQEQIKTIQELTHRKMKIPIGNATPEYQVFAGAVRSGKTYTNFCLLIKHWYEMLGQSGVDNQKQVRDEMKQFLFLRGFLK